LRLEIVRQIQFACQFVQVGALHEAVGVDREHAHQVDLSRHFHRACRCGDVSWVEGARDFLVDRGVVGEQSQLLLDQAAFAGVDVAVRLGSGDQRLQHHATMVFRGGRWQELRRLRDGRGRGTNGSLLLRPVAVGAERQYTECRGATAGDRLAAGGA